MTGKLLFLFMGLTIGSLFGSAITAWITSSSRREKIYQAGVPENRPAVIDIKSRIYLVKAE